MQPHDGDQRISSWHITAKAIFTTGKTK